MDAGGHGGGREGIADRDRYEVPLMTLPGASGEELAVERANKGCVCVCVHDGAHKGGVMCVAIAAKPDHTLAVSGGRCGVVCAHYCGRSVGKWIHKVVDRPEVDGEEGSMGVASASASASGSLCITVKRDPLSDVAWWIAVGCSAGALTVIKVSFQEKQKAEGRECINSNVANNIQEEEEKEEKEEEVGGKDGQGDGQREREGGQGGGISSRIAWRRKRLGGQAGLVEGSVLCVCIYAGTVIYATSTGIVRMAALQSGKALRAFRAHLDTSVAVTALAVRRGALVTGNAEGLVVVWDVGLSGLFQREYVTQEEMEDELGG